MWPTSGRWDDALRGSGRVMTTVDLWSNGAFVQSLQPVSGRLTVDESSKVRRSLSMVCADVDLTPVTPGDTLTPFGPELHVSMGVAYQEGDTELVPVGVLPITKAYRSQFLGGLQVEADDYSSLLSSDRWDTWATPAGALVTAEISRMAKDSLPNLTVVDLTGSTSKTSVSAWDHERWNAIENLAAAIGAEPFFDPQGRLIIRKVPQVTSGTTPVWTVDSYTDMAVMTDVAVGMSSDTVWNAVTATSSAPNVTLSATAYQQSGPFAWGAPFRRRRFYASPVLTSTAGCLSAAQSILARSVAFSRQLDPQSAPNPALDVGDAVLVAPPDELAGEVRIVSRIQLDLAGGAMSLQTRVTADVGTTEGSLS